MERDEPPQIPYADCPTVERHRQSTVGDSSGPLTTFTDGDFLGFASPADVPWPWKQSAA